MLLIYVSFRIEKTEYEGSVLMQELILMLGVFLALIGFVLVQSNLVHVRTDKSKASAEKQSQRMRRLGADGMILGGAIIIFTWLDLFTKHWSVKDTGFGILICGGLVALMEWRRRNA